MMGVLTSIDDGKQALVRFGAGEETSKEMTRIYVSVGYL